MSAFEDALDQQGFNLSTLQLILQLAYEFARNHGREMTPQELRAALLKPSQ